MDKESVREPKQAEPRWHVDLSWYKRQSRSFTFTASNSLCPKCQKRMKPGSDSASKLISFIRDCCSDSEDYIAPRLPVMESIFRVLLAAGNEPLSAEEILYGLNKWRGGVTLSVESLGRLLACDRYYGIKPVEG